MKKTIQERFDEKLIPEPYSGCYLWFGAHDRQGYGRISVGGRSGQAQVSHRIAWQLHRGEIPNGLDVCHTCDTPECVNPDHLFVGTRRDNMQDAANKGRTTIGERNPQSKLTEAQVLEIRSSPESRKVLAQRYGVLPNAISRIKSRKRWGYL